MTAETSYLELCQQILENGHNKSDRTGTGTISLFGAQMHFPLEEGFPLLTTKKIPFRLISSELLWFLKGDTNIRYLLTYNNHIWDEWAFEKYINSDDYHGSDMTNFGHRAQSDPAFNRCYQKVKQDFCTRILEDDEFAAVYGDLGHIYGAQWRAWRTSTGDTIDQIHQVIHDIQHHPDSRRLIVSAWNPEDVPTMALPPCHTLFQFYVADGRLSCQLYQRSADMFLGVPFNIASYALLTHLIARQTGLAVGEFIHTIGDAHIYTNHIEQVQTQLSREPRPWPQLWLNPEKNDIDTFEMEDIRIDNYNPYPAIKAPVAV